jgi:hypothetical protein
MHAYATVFVFKDHFLEDEKRPLQGGFLTQVTIKDQSRVVS